ncbi:hypothetical protein NPIL_111911 [Nephila pilipes]|uniref:Uncharacterized protein n=1 Tax=Nephila pilipes TaxID=299642 RepID=A0A8X6PU90_NEPPI|nr:hypothetical protein NPIL_111911 [Nephila pilipes]
MISWRLHRVFRMAVCHDHVPDSFFGARNWTLITLSGFVSGCGQMIRQTLPYSHLVGRSSAIIEDGNLPTADRLIMEVNRSSQSNDEALLSRSE